jgi:hypothetical protein
MFKRFLTLMAAVMLLAFAAVGCGDDNDGGSNGSGDNAAETQSEDTTTDATVESGDVEVPANLEEAVERCKESVGQAPQISDDAKSKLEDICDKAGSGDEQEIEEAAREVCETIVEESIPDGSPGREAALSACASAGGQ